MKSKLLRIGALILAVIALNYFLPLRVILLNSIDWFHQAGFIGVLVFALVFISASLFFMPVGPLMLVAGIVYGVINGYILVAISSLIAISLAYFIGKKFLQARVERYRLAYPRFEQFHRAVSHKGPLLVFLIRLNPFFPFSLLNYLFTIPHLNFFSYLLSSCLGMAPDILLYLYVGRLGADVLQGHAHFSGWNILFIVVALIATGVAAYIINNLVKKAAQEPA